MLRSLRRLQPLPRRSYATGPPPSRPFKAGPQLPHREAARKPAAEPATQPKQNEPTQPVIKERTQDPARGAAASLKAATEGVLDPRYKADSRRVLSIIVAMPIFLVMSWILYERLVLGVEQKHHVKKSEGDGDSGVELVEGAK